jgi:DNA (cytosine-5)-methyltransferase 1
VNALGIHIFAGGFSIGVEQHFDLLGHLERSSYGVKSWKQFRPGCQVCVSKKAEWPTGQFDGQVDFLYANPPCAAWSPTSVGYARKEQSPWLDWARDVLRVSEQVGARVTALESVRGAYRYGRAFYRGLAERHGMSLSWVFVNAVDHGLAQFRPRLFLLFAPRADGVFEPQFEPTPPPLVVEQAGELIEGDPASAPISPKSIYCPGHGITPADLMACIPAIRPGGKRLHEIPIERLAEVSPVVATKLKDVKFAGHLLTRLSEDRPSPIVYGLARYVHPTEDRLLTLRELMRLQGYPDDFLFEGTQATGLRMLGKTVTPNLGEWLAGEVAAHLRGERDVSYVDEQVFWCASDPMKLPPEPMGRPILMDNGGSMLVDPLSGSADGDPLAGSSDEEDAFLAAPAAQAIPARTSVSGVAPGATLGPRKRRSQVEDDFDEYRVGDVIKPSTWPRRRASAVRTLPVNEVRPEWLSLPGPTALARILIAEGRGDDEVLSATKTCFGGRTEGPHLFTRKDLERLRARIERTVSA